MHQTWHRLPKLYQRVIEPHFQGPARSPWLCRLLMSSAVLRPRPLAHSSCIFWLAASVLSALGSLAAAADWDLCATKHSQYSSYAVLLGMSMGCTRALLMSDDHDRRLALMLQNCIDMDSSHDTWGTLLFMTCCELNNKRRSKVESALFTMDAGWLCYL